MSAELELWRTNRNIPEIPETAADVMFMNAMGQVESTPELALYLIFRIMEGLEATP